jgi:hypothetical protein
MFDQLSKKEQLILLAGIFEGEGWFGLNRTNKLNYTPVAVLEVQMSDEDVVKKFQRYCNTNKKIHFKPKRKEHYKDQYRFTLSGTRALQLMEEMLPYLGIRRKEQYYAVVQSIGNGPKNWSPPVLEQTKDEAGDVRCTTDAC